jgi:hypothetical protein
MSWGASTGSAATVGIRQNCNGTLEFKDNATGSWTEFGSSLDDTTFGDAATDVYTFTGQITASQGALIADDKKLYFGTGQDASIEYDENGTDELRFAGAAATFEQDVTFDNDVTLGVAATDVTTVTSRLTASQGALIADDMKLWFGSGQDAYIEHDEAGSDELVISGSDGGIQIILPVGTSDAINIGTSDQSMLSAYTHSGLRTWFVPVMVQLSDDTRLLFGAGSDASIEYDENGTDELRFAGAAATFEQDVTFDNDVTLGVAAADVTTVTGRLTASQGMLIADDKKLYFGTGQDASIEYDENGSNRLIIDAPAGGVDITGSLYVSGSVYANEYIVDTMTTTVTNIEQRGSTKFGDSADDTHQFTGSVHIADDNKIYFGANNNFSIEYDEDGTNTAQFAGVASVFSAAVTFGSTVYCNANVTLNNAATEVTTVTGRLTASQGALIADDMKLWFGTGQDAYIEYDEAGSDELILSGAAGGIDIQVPVKTSDAFTISSDGSAYMTISTVGPQNAYTQFNKSVNIIDDTSLYFGTGFDINMQYDEDGTDTLLVDGTGGMTMADDFKLYFGTGLDASIEYDEDGTDELIISGSKGGISILGPLSSTDSVTIGSAAGSLVTVDTSNMVTVLNESARVADDKKLYFGTNEDASFEYDENGTDTLLYAGASFRISDDVKLEFGTGGDASIEYDENGTDELIISGALGGIDIQMPQAADALTLSYAGGAFMTVSTAGGQNDYTQFNKSVNMIDDTGLYFGTGFDINMQYDEDGTDTLLVDGTGGMTMADDFKLYFGTGLDASIEYDEDGTDELIISGAVGGISILGPLSSTDSVTIGSAAGSLITVDSANMVTVFNESAKIADDKKLYFGDGEEASIEYDEDGTDRLIFTVPSAGMSIGPGFHRVAQDVTVNKAHSGDNSVAVQMQGVFVPNNSIITKVVAIPSVLSNLGTAIYNLSISATNGTAADSNVATPTEILGAGASDTEDSDGGSASDIVLSSGGVNKKVWINETNIKTTYDAFVYVANAGTGNGTTDPSQGTLHVIIEYYGLE